MTTDQKRKNPAFVFDLGGVLIDWNPRHLFRKLFDGDETRMEYFLTEVCPHTWNRQMDAGYPFERAVEERSRIFPDQAQYIRAYWERYDETVAGEISGTVEILKELKAAGYALFTLSNWSAETFERVRGRFPFLELFDEVIISGYIGLVKPDKAIFDYLLMRTSRPAGECLFIDDIAGNIEAASKLGFQTFLFTTPENFRVELEARGILTK